MRRYHSYPLRMRKELNANLLPTHRAPIGVCVLIRPAQLETLASRQAAKIRSAVYMLAGRRHGLQGLNK